MADNVVANAGSGGDTFAADDIGGVKFPRTKLIHGADGVNAGDVATGNPLPIQLRNSGGTEIGTNANPVQVGDGGSTISVDDGAGSLTVDGTVAISGAVPVTDNGGSLTVDGSVTVVDGGGSITVDGTVAISGTVAVTDNSGSLTVDAPTGTPVNVQIGDGTRQATVRDTGASDSLNVAIVDASGNQITSFGGGTEYTEDVAAAADPVGKAAILVRADTPGTVTNANGDNVAQRGTNYGAAYVQVISSSGAFIDSFGGSGGTAMADNGAFTGGTTNVTPMGALYDTTPPTITDGNVGVPRMDANRNLHIVNTDIAKAEDSAHSSGDSGVMALAVRSDSGSLLAADGDYIPLSVNGSGALRVAQVGTATVVASNASGDTAHDGADSGSPVKIGGKAYSTEPAVVSANDRANMITDLVGRPIVLPYAAQGDEVDGTASATGTSDTQIIAAQGAGVRIYVTTLIIHNAHATTNGFVTIKDGTTAKLVVPAPANGGAVINLPVPMRLTANTALNFAASASITTIYVSAVGFKSAA